MLKSGDIRSEALRQGPSTNPRPGQSLIALLLIAALSACGSDTAPGTIDQLDTTDPLDTTTEPDAEAPPPDTNEPPDADTAVSEEDALDPDTTEPADADTSDAQQDAEDADSADTEEVDILVPPPPAPEGPPCTTNGNCSGPTGICDPIYLVCVACVTHSDCGWDKRCEVGVCVGEGKPKCLHDHDCLGSPDGPTCLAERMVCGQCYEDWQCPGDGKVCVDNACVDGVSQVHWCATTADCPTGRVCSDVGHCVECEVDFECGEGARCHRWRCEPIPVPEPSYIPRPCESDLQCLDLGVDCNKSLGLCAAGPLCATDCPAGYGCTDNVCVRQACREGQAYCASSCRERAYCISQWTSGPYVGTLVDHWVCVDGQWELGPGVSPGTCDETQPYESVPQPYTEYCSAGPPEFCRSAYQAIDLHPCSPLTCPCTPHAPKECLREPIYPHPW